MSVGRMSVVRVSAATPSFVETRSRIRDALAAAFRRSASIRYEEQLALIARNGHAGVV